MNNRSYNIAMKKTVIEKMEDLLKVAADETRIKIMLCLLDENACTCDCTACGCCADCTCLSCMIEKCVGDIVVETGASQSLISHQLKILKDFDLVATRREGKKIFYSLKDGHIKQLISVVLEHAKED